MISVSIIKGLRLSEAAAGDFFMPREPQSGERFLVGTINTQFPVGIALEGKQPFFFHDLPVLEGRRGFVVSDCQIFLDPGSAMPWRGNGDDKAPLGSLIIRGEDVAIRGHGRNNLQAFVGIRGDAIPEESDAAAFTRWAIMAKNEEEAWNSLFENSGSDAWIESFVG